MTELSIRGVSLKSARLVVLDRVSFGVAAGELLALIGPNGAGKTSIFNCINCIYRPEGEITFRGRSLIGLASTRPLRPASHARFSTASYFRI